MNQKFKNLIKIDEQMLDGYKNALEVKLKTPYEVFFHFDCSVCSVI